MYLIRTFTVVNIITKYLCKLSFTEGFKLPTTFIPTAWFCSLHRRNRA